MLTALFRRNQPAALLLLLLMVPLLWPGGAFGVGHAGDHPKAMPLYAALSSLLAQPFWAFAIGALSVVGLSVQLTFLANDLELWDRRNHLPALLLPLLLACGTHGLWPSPALLGMHFVLWAFRLAWAVQGRPSALGLLFNAGFLLGVASLFYLPYAFLLVVVWASTSVMRPFIWRDHVVALLGLSLPIYLCWGGLRVLGLDGWHPLESLILITPIGKPFPAAYVTVLLSLLGCFALAALGAFASDYGRAVMRGKNTRAGFLAFAFTSGLIVVFELLVNHSYPPVLVAVPLAVLFSYPMLFARRTVLADLGAWCLLGMALWARFGA